MTSIHSLLENSLASGFRLIAACLMIAMLGGCVTTVTGNGIEEASEEARVKAQIDLCLLYTSQSPRDRTRSRMPSSA